jgi:hypothetical protein
MKTTFLVSLLLFASSFIYSQTNYEEGFNSGYKNGYCYGQGVGCIPPIPPICPIPLIGESNDNYRQGYNRGFSMGQNARQYKENQNTNYTGSSSYSGNNYAGSSGMGAVANPNFVNNMMSYSQQRQQRQNEDVNNYNVEQYNKTRDFGRSVFDWVRSVQNSYITRPNNNIETRRFIDKLSDHIEYLRDLAKRLSVNNWNEIREDIISEKDNIEQDINDYNIDQK